MGGGIGIAGVREPPADFHVAKINPPDLGSRARVGLHPTKALGGVSPPSPSDGGLGVVVRVTSGLGCVANQGHPHPLVRASIGREDHALLRRQPAGPGCPSLCQRNTNLTSRRSKKTGYLYPAVS